jgi:hypothetical protein
MLLFNDVLNSCDHPLMPLPLAHFIGKDTPFTLYQLGIANGETSVNRLWG